MANMTSLSAFYLICLVAFGNANKIQNNLRLLEEEIVIYTLEDVHKEKISLPSNKLTKYQFASGSSAKYKVKSGSSIGVNTYGTVYPKNTTWYWYGNMGTTAKPGEGQTPTRIEIGYTYGSSTIEVTENGSTKTVNFKVVSYGQEYAEKIIDNYIANNVTKAKTNYDKYDSIAAFPAQYPYSAKYQSYVNMVVMEGGDCWASSNTIIHLCEKVGIKAHLRYAANDGGSGSGHRNVAALIDGKIYIAEAGYGYTSPNRPHNIKEENTGFCIQTLDSKLKTAKFVQYDGFDENIKLQGQINGYTIVEIETQAFYYGETYSGVSVKSVQLPDTIEKIGDASFFGLKLIESITIPKNVSYIGKRTFSNCPKLTQLKIDTGNKYFSLDKSVLYNYNKTKLLSFVSAGGSEYTASTKLTEVDEYAFYYAKNVTKLVLPSTVTKIGEGAFGDSSLKEIYFSGPQPTIEKYAFASINVTVYYPKNKNWNTTSVNKDKAKQVTFVQWDPSSTQTVSGKSFLSTQSNTLIWVIAIIIGIVILGIGRHIINSRKSRNVDSV